MPGGANDPYEVLGVPRDADADAIKRAYRTLALRNHPDRNPGDADAEERFKTISEAYATLRDPEARQRFDTYGHVGRGPVGAQPDFSHVDWRVIFQEADIPIDWSRRGGVPTTGNVVFDALFRGVTTMFRQAGLLPGEDREVRAGVDLGTARTGGRKRIHLPGPVTCSTCRGSGHDHEGSCATCGGTGRLARGISVDVTVPARVRPGTKLRLAGMGGPGQPPGDAYVEVAVELPTGFRSEGRDLVGEVYVTPLEASRGLSAIVLGVPVSVPPGVRDGQGVQVAGGGLGGDLVLTVRIDIWRGLARAALDTARSALTAIRRTVTDERKLP
ncbi:MAG: J domain-containing protein [Trueperaceae bacterium]|nr:MAG: J domain-containing protein [Trueperaceae bacterium]